MTATPPLHDRRIAAVRPLVPPQALLDDLPLTDEAQHVVQRGRQAVTDVLNRDDDRLIAIVGPCSIHDPEAALEYAGRLAEHADQLDRDLVVVMRAYFEKPRTADGWKGLINDPLRDGSNHINDGLRIARSLLLQFTALKLPVAAEFLDPSTPQYLADVVSWAAIGARTTLSQVHRQLASGLSMPVAFKNPPDGDMQGAVDAAYAAANKQVFPGITEEGVAAIFETTGNPDCHVVLRGGADGPNYDSGSIRNALACMTRRGLPRRVIVDASHANSGKDHTRQAVVAEDIAASLSGGEAGIVGVMLESFLVAGRQDLPPGGDRLVYGQSITDACIDWESTVSIMELLAKAVERRRAKLAAADHTT